MIATVVAGLVLGTTTRVRPMALLSSAAIIAVAFIIVVVARLGVTVTIASMLHRTSERIPRSWVVLATWGGLRGALAMVLALALPSDFPQRALLINLTFGVVIASLLLQGADDSEPHRPPHRQASQINRCSRWIRAGQVNPAVFRYVRALRTCSDRRNSMRRLGTFLLAGGVAIGAAVGLALLAGVRIVGVPWLVEIGLTKLTLLASAGLMSAGAVLLRLDRRSAARRALPNAGRTDDEHRRSIGWFNEPPSA